MCVVGASPGRASAEPHLQPFQLLLEVVLIHDLDFAELLLILAVLLPHHLHLVEDLRRPVAGSPSGWGRDGHGGDVTANTMGQAGQAAAPKVKGTMGSPGGAGAS